MNISKGRSGSNRILDKRLELGITTQGMNKVCYLPQSSPQKSKRPRTNVQEEGTWVEV